jgi:hypothetical protein
MATNINTILNWFMTGKKPTQAQFWASWSSFWHKDEAIPQSSISGLATVLNAKTENDQFNAHKTDANAHSELFLGKEDKTQKGVAGGYVPLNGVIKIASQYLNIVNDLVSGGSTSLLSAEQGKLLQTQITAINTLLNSNDINLDTVQELVDAIKTVETSISTILVNDLTTGGTTKALTAEMGKALKDLIDSLTTIVSGKEPAITGGVAGQYYDHNKTWQTIPVVDISGKQDIANQVEVTTSQDAQASWHGKTVFFMANVTVTIPASGLPSGYTFEGVTAPSCTVSWAITTPKVWALGAPAATPEKSIFTLMQLMSNSNNIYLFGL